MASERRIERLAGAPFDPTIARVVIMHSVNRRRWRRWLLTKLDFWLNAFASLSLGYIAVGGVLASDQSPTHQPWKPWGTPFIILVAAVAYGVLFGVYTYVRRREEKQTAREHAAAIACQKIAYALADRCPGVDPRHLSVAMWLCRDDHRFDYVAQFLLKAGRDPCGVTWERGKGVAGSLWDDPGPDRARSEKLVRRNHLTDKTFDRLSQDERLGLSYAEWQHASEFTGVVAVRESNGEGERPLGFLVVDYTGDLTRQPDGRDQVDEIGDVLRRDAWLQDLRSALKRRVAKL